MTAIHPAIAYELGVVPEPLAEPAGLIQFLRLLRDNQLSVYTRGSFVDEFGETRLFFHNFVLVNEPDFIEHILVANHQNYVKGQLTRQILQPALGNSLLISEGAFWRRQRRIMAPAFHRQHLAKAAAVMVRRAGQRIGHWRAPCEMGERLDVAHEMMSLTMEIVTEALFSSDIADSIGELGQAVTTLSASLGTPNPFDILGFPEWFPRWRSRRTRSALARLDRTIYDIIAARRATREVSDDLLGLLLSARDEETGEGMTDTQLRDEVITFFAAGHETTALALTWTLYLLSRHPEIERTLHDEVDCVLGDGETTFADVDALPYTRMVIQEAMRLFPPVHALSRAALADDEVGGARHSCRQRGLDQPLRHPPQSAAVEGPAALRSRAIHTRSEQNASSFRVPAFRRRPAHLYRQGLCHGGGVPRARHHRPRVPPAYGAGTPGRSAGQGHPSPALRSSHDARAALTGRRTAG